MKKSVVIFMMFIGICVATTVFALSGDPPLWGGKCDPEQEIKIDSPDFAFPVSLVHKWIGEQKIKMIRAKMAPYIQIDPKTGKESYQFRYQTQADAALREAEEWERRAKDRVEKYMENDPCPITNMGLVIRNKYLELIW